MLRKLFLYDLVQGFRQNAGKLAVIAILTFVFCFEFYFYITGRGKYDDTLPGENFGTYLLQIFGGMKFFRPAPGVEFQFPIKWMLFYSVFFYSTLNYPYKDMQGMGVNYIVKSGKRYMFWLSKCLWTILFLSAELLVVFLVIGGFCLVTGASLSLIPNMEYIEMFTKGENLSTFALEEDYIWVLTCVPMLMALALGIFQQTMILFVKPLFAFLVTEGILLASAGSTFLLMPGTYMMAVRSRQLVSEGFLVTDGILIAAIVLVVSLVLGILRFKRYNITM